MEGTLNVLRAAAAARSKPWLLFASSREVYGEPRRLPVGENVPPVPVNIYGRSKAEGEKLVLAARGDGGRTAIVRFSNVYGRTDDHPDRVVPAFARAAAEGTDLRVNGKGCTFDFTHLDDTVAGILLMIEQLEDGADELPAVHLCTGHGTTLGEPAQMANRIGGYKSCILEMPERCYDVARFVGDTRRAVDVLGWRAKVDIAAGVERLVHDFLQSRLRLDARCQIGPGPLPSDRRGDTSALAACGQLRHHLCA